MSYTGFASGSCNVERAGQAHLHAARLPGLLGAQALALAARPPLTSG